MQNLEFVNQSFYLVNFGYFNIYLWVRIIKKERNLILFFNFSRIVVIKFYILHLVIAFTITYPFYFFFKLITE